jgi:hypothetical protein
LIEQNNQSGLVKYINQILSSRSKFGKNNFPKQKKPANQANNLHTYAGMFKTNSLLDKYLDYYLKQTIHSAREISSINKQLVINQIRHEI